MGDIDIVVGDVEQPQVGRAGVLATGHLGAQLRQHQRGCAMPLRVRGVGKREIFHAGAAQLRLRAREGAVFLAAGRAAARVPVVLAAGFFAEGAAFGAAWLAAVPTSFKAVAAMF